MHISLLITFKEEVSNHTGYCSDAECTLSYKTYKKLVDVDITEITNDLQYYVKYADYVDAGDGGSYYCDVSEEVIQSGLNRHEARITVLKVMLVDKYESQKRTDI